MIVRELMRSSFRLIQDLAPGQTGHADDETDGLLVLNSMLDAWGADPLMPYATARDVYALTPNQASVTIGDSGELDGARPVRLKFAALITSPGLTPPAAECELALLSPEEYSRGASGLYSDRAYPDATLYVSPIPTSAAELVLYTWGPFCAFTSMTQTVLMPPGYTDAIRYNLAVRLAPEWNRVLRADVARLAYDAVAALKSINAPAPIMRPNPDIGGYGCGGGFNILTGRY